jgi:orotate phosphoribosyltransferase
VDLIPQKREELYKIIKNEGISFREVTLSSNIKSNFYYDIKSVVNSSAVVLIGELMLDMIIKRFPGTVSVGGLEVGALPVTTAIVFFSNQADDEYRVSGFFVRKQTKTHGLQKRIEGKPKEPMVIVDDVVTTGQSVIDAVEALREEGYSPLGIVSVIDREDERKLEQLKSGALKYYSLFKHSEFEDYIRSKKAIKN